MRYPVIFYTLIQLFAGCRNELPQRVLDFSVFTVYVPAGWYKIDLQGIDSYVGGLTNGTDSLTFDYGWYSYDFGSEDMDKHLFATDTVNGKMATLVKPVKAGRGTVGIYIRNAYRENHFNLIGSHIKDEPAVFRIFQSIRFPDSDTTVNAVRFAQKFKTTKYPPSAKAIFNMNCASCHNTSDQPLTGPGFATIDPKRFQDWFFDTSLVYSPPSNMGTEFHRKTFQSLSKEELEILRQMASKRE